MPDKNKKRKNNKNKRRNKGQGQQNQSNSTSLNDIKQVELTPKFGEQTSASCNDTSDFNKNTETSVDFEQQQVISGSILINKELEAYTVELPEKVINGKQKLQNDMKSKSVDNDDQPTIVEIVDGTDKPEKDCTVVNTSNIIVTEVDPEVRWEKTDEMRDLKVMTDECLVPSLISITTIPLNLAECVETKSMSPEEEKSLRKYLNTLNLSTNLSDSKTLEIKSEIEQLVDQDIKQRLRKRCLVEDNFMLRAGPSRSLHVIDEEASGESSNTSRRQSYLSDKKSDNEELEDDVFHPPNHKNQQNIVKRDKKRSNLIAQECIRVDTQIKDPDMSEARGSWTTKTVETMTGAEIVYLTDSSSSTSSIYENNDNEEFNDESDVSVRIITPTIEVIDAESFLKNNGTHSQPDRKVEDDKIKIIYNTENASQPKEKHEIVVASTENFNTNLYVKDLEVPNLELNTEVDVNSLGAKKVLDNYDLEIKVLKCELNDAINNLINEVVSDSDTAKDVQNELITRQDSSSSVGSSQCTAKYNPSSSSLNDINGTEFEESGKGNSQPSDINKSHVKDVIETIEDHTHNVKSFNTSQTLREICLETISKLPYGEQILEELATVSKRLQTLSEYELHTDLQQTSLQLNPSEVKHILKSKVLTPPPVQPRNSSLKVNQDDCKNNTVFNAESMRINCLSPSQKMLMEKTNTIPYIKATENCKYEQKTKNINTSWENMPDVSFKSQTGSRLLALLRNPLVSTQPKDNKSTEVKNSKYETRNIKHDRSTYSSELLKKDHNTEQTLSSFKPIPPPKPKKYSSSYYESDESSNFVESSFKSINQEKKYFHFSTGNLSQEIEQDISSIQNMHKNYNDIYRQARQDLYPRRPSLPKDLCDKQMEYIRQKEKEVEAEIHRLERDRAKAPHRGPRAPMLNDEKYESDSFHSTNRITSSRSYGVLPSHIAPASGKLSSVFSKSQEELLRNKMYTEYISQMAEREERKHQKVIKITKTPSTVYPKSSSELSIFDSKINNPIEKEFIDKAKERWSKMGIRDSETDDEYEKKTHWDREYREPNVMEHKIKVIDSGEEKDVKKLPNHLQDFVKFRTKDKCDKTESPGESGCSETSHGVILCAVIVLIFTITKYILRLFRRQ